MQAYLNMYEGYPNFKVAREIVEKYVEYPVISWRNLFNNIANQLAEFDGDAVVVEVPKLQTDFNKND